jgi:hypothetical protein
MNEFELPSEQNINSLEEGFLTDAQLLEIANDIENSDEMGRHEALELGLPADTDRETIAEEKDRIYISKIATALGLDPNTPHEKVLEVEYKRGLHSLGHLIGGLGLTYDATPEEIEKAQEKRRQKRIDTLRKVVEDIRANRAKDVTPKKSKQDKLS